MNQLERPLLSLPTFLLNISVKVHFSTFLHPYKFSQSLEAQSREICGDARVIMTPVY